MIISLGKFPPCMVRIALIHSFSSRVQTSEIKPFDRKLQETGI